MKVSLNTIKQFTTVDLPVDELVKKINQQLGGVEEVIDLDAKYKDAVIVKVVECEKHPDADRLSVCMIDAGESNSELRTSNSELIQVVCGAPNARAGMWAIWLPPGATVPATYGGTDPFVLDAREIRGVKSHGMLAAADELAIGSDHAGIVELTDDDLSPFGTIQKLEAGLSFAKVFGLDDTIIDIENKMFTHRPDLFGQLGVAREIAGIQGIKFTSPKWYLQKFGEISSAKGDTLTEGYVGLESKRAQERKSGELPLRVVNEAEMAVPRFMAVAIRDVTVRPSPMWLQCALVALGGKPINTIVDVTNYVMLLTAQPTHAYDYDKLRGQFLGTRFAQKGEKLTLLNDKTYQLDESDVVIVDGEGPVGLAGIMGGGNSEVSDTTKNIVLECANFDMYTMRRSSMRHGLFTDALTRFNKGQSPLQNPIVLNLLMMSVRDVAGGEQASPITDLLSEQLASRIDMLKAEMIADEPAMFEMVTPSVEFINARLGTDLSTATIKTLLGNVEFHVVDEDGSTDEQRRDSKQYPRVIIQAPFWRTDIEHPEDIVEEVGRLYGFDKLPRVLPRRSIAPARKNELRELKHRIRDSLSRAGANEVLTYSFVHENVMKNAEQDTAQAFQLSNALSPDLQYYRLSVLPSLLDRVHANIKAGYDEFILFEIGKGHNKKYHAADDKGLPAEMEFVDAVYASKKPREGAAYYRAQRLVVQLCEDLGFEVRCNPIEDALDYPVTAPFDQTRSALVESLDGTFIGMVGELKQSVLHRFKLPAYSAAMTLDIRGLLEAHRATGTSYMMLSKYPSVTQDVSLKVPSTLSYRDVFARALQTIQRTSGRSLRASLEPLSIYQAPDDGDHKTITLRLVVASYDKTLTDDAVAKVLEAVAEDIAQM